MFQGYTTRHLVMVVLAMTLVALAESDNKILGTPRVVCTQEGLMFEMETENPFAGQLYVKNEFENPKCRVNFRELGKKPGAAFRLNFNECSMRRQRMVAPKGMVYSVTMMVQFHDVFVTQGDKAFQIRCFYQEIDLGNVTSALDVSPLTTTLMDSTNSLPTCSYSIRLKSTDGPKASIAKVGDTVVHMFKCEESGYKLYRLLIKDCYVDDGKQNKHRLIGSDGCSLDPDIVQTPVYVENKLEAFAEASVFKWPDEPSVYFQCQISLCMQESGTCDYVTPPKCSKRSSRELRRNKSNIFDVNSIDFDLDVNKITVIDVTQDLDASQQNARLVNRFLNGSESESESEHQFGSASRIPMTACFGAETMIIFGIIFFVLFVLLMSTFFKLFSPFCCQSNKGGDDLVRQDYPNVFSTLPNMYYVDWPNDVVAKKT